MPPEAQPQIPQNPEPSQELSRTQHLVGLTTLGLMGIAGFFFVFGYLDNVAAPNAQVAAAANAQDVFEGISLVADAAIVVDITTGEALFEKNADAQLPLASLTKVPLALAVSEALSPDESITLPYDTSFTEGGQRLLAGEKWSVRDLLHFTLIASSNEGAQILADAADTKLRALYSIPAEEPAALWRMNDLAKGLGLNSTYFRNVHGLDLSLSEAGSYGSARDIAKLFSYAATARPEVFAGTAKDDLRLTDASGRSTVAFNTNEALGSIPGLIMGKTGYTDLAGGNLAIVFDAGLSQPFVAVVLGSTYDGRFADMRKLVEKTGESIAQQ